MNLTGDPAAIEALAGTLASRASQVSSVGRRVEARANSCSWQSRKADRFRNEMRARRGQSERLAGELTDLSHRLRRLAGEVRTEQRVLGMIERRIRDAIDAFVPGPDLVAPWDGTGWGPDNLPAAGDPIWRDVGRSLGM